MKTSAVLESYGGDKMKPIRKIKLWRKLGLPACYKLGLIKENHCINVSDNRESFIKENKQVFEGLGMYVRLMILAL